MSVLLQPFGLLLILFGFALLPVAVYIVENKALDQPDLAEWGFVLIFAAFVMAIGGTVLVGVG